MTSTLTRGVNIKMRQADWNETSPAAVEKFGSQASAFDKYCASCVYALRLTERRWLMICD